MQPTNVRKHDVPPFVASQCQHHHNLPNKMHRACLSMKMKYNSLHCNISSNSEHKTIAIPILKKKQCKHTHSISKLFRYFFFPLILRNYDCELQPKQQQQQLQQTTQQNNKREKKALNGECRCVCVECICMNCI